MAEAKQHHPETAFPETREMLSLMAGEMEIDEKALSAPIRECDLQQCRGTCCHDGAYLSSEEANVIRELAETHREDFAELGIELPEQAVVYGKWRDVASGPKTATRPAPMREWVDDYPQHFPETNCVFLHPETAYCGLQMLAQKQGKPKWYYKPGTCWMHPLSIVKGEGNKPRLTLHSPESDPQRYSDYDGFVCRTHCGRPCSTGDAKPAREVLAEEIAEISREIEV